MPTLFLQRISLTMPFGSILTEAIWKVKRKWMQLNKMQVADIVIPPTRNRVSLFIKNWLTPWPGQRHLSKSNSLANFYTRNGPRSNLQDYAKSSKPVHMSQIRHPVRQSLTNLDDGLLGSETVILPNLGPKQKEQQTCGLTHGVGQLCTIRLVKWKSQSIVLISENTSVGDQKSTQTTRHHISSLISRFERLPSSNC